MTIENIKEWFERAVPEPTDKSRAVQIGCHFEEVAEMMAVVPLFMIEPQVKEAATKFKTSLLIEADSFDRKELLDALCDQIVTAIGVGHMFGMDVLGALAEVNRSNWSKFVDGVPVFDENGKIAKPASYSKPDLTPFV